MPGRVGSDVEDLATDGGKSGFSILPIEAQQLLGAEYVLPGAQKNRENNNEESSNGAGQPNDEIDSDLLPPCHAHVFMRHATNDPNGEVWYYPC